MIELEEAVMEIIVNAGQSRSLCFEALHAAREATLTRQTACYARRTATLARRTICRPN